MISDEEAEKLNECLEIMCHWLKKEPSEVYGLCDDKIGEIGGEVMVKCLTEGVDETLRFIKKNYYGRERTVALFTLLVTPLIAKDVLKKVFEE